MKLESVVKKIQKRIPGVTIHTEDRPSAFKGGTSAKHWFAYNGKIASFYSCDHRGASNFHIRRENDHSDSMTDYFAGSFYDNATQMINTLCPLPPKFPAGSLVRGKNNKRAGRLGIAGRYGLVTHVNSYSCYTLLMTDTGREERYSYERDLEAA